jgi:hypothetical protein
MLLLFTLVILFKGVFISPNFLLLLVLKILFEISEFNTELIILEEVPDECLFLD